MPFLRRLYKIPGMIIWAIIVCIIAIPCHFRGWEGTRGISRITRLWARGMAKILNLHVKKYGDISDVKGGLIVSNHLGYLDIIAHGTLLPVRFTSTVAISTWPIIGPFIDFSRPVLVNRTSAPASRKSSRDFAKTMAQGMYLIVYPEGTSTDGKSGIRPFKSTSFDAAVIGNKTILPIITRYREVPGRETVCWYGDMTLIPHLWRILGYSSIDVELYFLDPVLPEGRSRKDLATFVHSVMEEAYKNLSDIEKEK